jgi:SAM-dependent methyltransferase
VARADYWNHNVHYQPVILRAVPPGCGAALEVGCGDGLLASRLAERCAEVTAIDRDAPMIALARARAQAAGPGRVSVVGGLPGLPAGRASSVNQVGRAVCVAACRPDHVAGIQPGITGVDQLRVATGATPPTLARATARTWSARRKASPELRPTLSVSTRCARWSPVAVRRRH